MWVPVGLTIKYVAAATRTRNNKKKTMPTINTATTTTTTTNIKTAAAGLLATFHRTCHTQSTQSTPRLTLPSSGDSSSGPRACTVPTVHGLDSLRSWWCAVSLDELLRYTVVRRVPIPICGSSSGCSSRYSSSRTWPSAMPLSSLRFWSSGVQAFQVVEAGEAVEVVEAAVTRPRDKRYQGTQQQDTQHKLAQGLAGINTLGAGQQRS